MHLNNKKIVVIETLFINCIIYTMDLNNSVYEAMGVSKGKIVFIGSNNEAINILDENTKIIDLGHKTVIPGFIDTYMKISENMIMRKYDLNLFNCKNVEEYLDTINQYIYKNSYREVIYGSGWNYNKFFNYNNSYKGPNKKLLNDISSDKAIVLRDITGSALWINDKAFERFGINKNTISPVGGIIELDENGELWGILKGNAVHLVNIKEIVEYRDKDYFNGFIKLQDKLHSYGITSIGLVRDKLLDMPLDIYRLLEIKDKLKLRVYYGTNIFPHEVGHKTIYEQLHELKRLKIIYKGKYFDITRACFQADGSIKMHNAFLFKPYMDNEKSDKEYLGRFMWDLLEFKEGIKMANRLDFNVSIEAQGDNACKVSIDGIEYSQKNNNDNKCRNSIVNLDLITKYYIRRMKLLGISAIIHPFWYYQSIDDTRKEYESIGEGRIQRLYPYKSLIDNSIVTGASSEYYIEDCLNPIKGIWCAVTRNLYDFKNNSNMKKDLIIEPKYRLNPTERVNILEAVRSVTINSAYILGKEKEVGSLELGKNADFIVLDKNIFESNQEEISNISVYRTYFEGKLVYIKE